MITPKPLPESHLPSVLDGTVQASDSITAVDLFCGIGGLTHGLLQAGIDVSAGIDIDETCKYVYEENNKSRFIAKDICKTSSSDLKALYSKNTVKLLAGCAPCQPFSSHTRKYKNRKEDARWGLLTDFQRLVEGVSPEIVAVENVPSLQKQDVFTAFVSKLHELGYQVFQTVVYCPDYGIPQTRRRLVLLASLLGEIAFTPRTHARSHELTAGTPGLFSKLARSLKPLPTVRATIGELPEIEDGQICREDPLHRTRSLSSLNKERIRQSKPGGTWLDWEASLRAPCHQRESGQSYKSVYARMSWDEPAPTITTQFYNFGTGRFGHPEQDRALSLREGALLQTFPEDYNFFDPSLSISFHRLGTHIGNALPVQLGTVIGHSIREHLEEVCNG